MKINADIAKWAALNRIRVAVGMIGVNDRKAHVAYGESQVWSDLYFAITDEFLYDDCAEYCELDAEYCRAYLPEYQ